MTAAAAFVSLIAVVAIFCTGLILGGWLSTLVGRNEWQELDDHERAQAALRHPSAGGQS